VEGKGQTHRPSQEDGGCETWVADGIPTVCNFLRKHD